MGAKLIKLILFLSCFAFSFPTAQANTADFEMRVSWVRSLKELLQELDKKEPEKFSHLEKRFLESFSFINQAWADSRYNCFYAGWPSVLVKSGSKNLCTNPSRGNSGYQKSVCKSDELQCQPLLFGNALCVSSKTQQERNQAFANCEKKFQVERKGNYDFLNKPSRKEIEDLRELSLVAKEICVKKPSTICQKIMKKLPNAMKALDEGHHQAVTKEDTKVDEAIINAKVTLAITPSAQGAHAENCEDPNHEHEILAASVEKITKTTQDELYEKIKLDFLSSPFCDPQKVLNDPTNRPAAGVIVALERDLKFLDKRESTPQVRENILKIIEKKYALSSSVVNSVSPYLHNMPASGNEDLRRNNSAKVKGLVIQDFLKNYRPSPEMGEIALHELAGNKIFSETDDGEIECPFVSKDAFLKALEGRNGVLAKHGSKVRNKDQITIVDYSRPSNERRMFVIDLKSEKILHNTWVAHGGGTDNQAKGVDGFGSSPKVSNTNGSLMSSDGFVLAGQAAVGSLYGPNVLLQGVDQNNSNIASRAIVIHGWSSPMAGYSNGVSDYNFQTDDYDPPADVIQRIKHTDFSNGTTKEMEKALNGIGKGVANGPYLPATEGCLGVPIINTKHLDHQGRDKTQLELLREDLPGSIIFNYSGPSMSSRYFK